MKQLKKVATVSFAALSVSLMISNTSQAEQAGKENLVEELQTKYTDYSNNKLEISYKSSDLGADDTKDLGEVQVSPKEEYESVNSDQDTNQRNYIKEEAKPSLKEKTGREKEDKKVVEDREEVLLEEKAKPVKQAEESVEKKASQKTDKKVKEIYDLEVPKENLKLEKNTYLEKTSEKDQDERLEKQEALEKDQAKVLKKEEAQVKGSTSKVLPERIQGKNRYETAVKIANQYKSLKDSKEVILVNGNSYADGISATSLSEGKMPILYVKEDAIPYQTNEEILRRLQNNPLKVYLMGGEKVISKRIEDYLKSLSITTERIAGKDRYETSVLAAKKSSKKNIIITTGEDFCDPLVATSLGASKDAKVILTNPDRLENTTARYLQANKNAINNVTIVGGTKAVSSRVANQVTRITGKSAERISGSNRYEGSVAVAKKVSSAPNKLIVASGQDFADALAIAPIAQGSGIPIILTKTNELPKEVISYFKDNREAVKSVLVIGGQSAISSEVARTVTNTLNNVTVKLPGESDVNTSSVDKYKSYFEKGVDLSRYNGNVNLDEAKRKNAVDFVILKAGSGVNPKDSGNGFVNAFETNYKKAKKAGLNVGAYWYLYASNIEEAKEEANLFLEQLCGKQFEYPVFLDFEDPSQRGISKKTKTDMALAFMDILEKNGYYTGIYSSASWLNNEFETARLADYDKWVAHWGVEKPGINQDYGLWQTTNKAKVAGIPSTSEGGVDFNYSYKDYPAIIKAAHLNNF
ncbi:MAG: cell wall-binding repeat-containing protein [Finegoldia sp.]|nr:cell wall-binding repeat-containing protein [Finegoldia sp.]